MDKQLEKLQIPVNTRTVGNPGGVYVLYLEDYVHTFIKKLLEESAKKDNLYKCTDEIFFYGNRFEEGKRTILVVSGASDIDSVTSKKEKYFSEITMLGVAKATINKDFGIQIEISLSSDVKVILDDFYIFYDQNEEMQNYLIEWNLRHQTSFAHTNIANNYLENKSDLASYLNKKKNNNDEGTQNDEKDEIKVGFIWNAMNVLSLGFVICVTVYGIVSINNYHKMQGIKEKVDYCMSVISENDLKNEETIKENDYINEIEQMPETSQVEETIEIIKETTYLEQKSNETVTSNSQTDKADILQEDNIKDFPQAQTESNYQELAQQEADTEVNIIQSETEMSIPQYYIVRKGDTLRTICFDAYGDYSRVNEVCEYNNITNPDDIHYGQRLLLP